MSGIYVGTSGFGYKEWRPMFYPAKLPPDEFLTYYASKLSAVEIDYTFYRLPTAALLDKWRAATPERFRFTIKASQRITHFDRLRMPSTALDLFLEAVPRLGSRLGGVLWQLPPNFRLDPARLEAFLTGLPADLPGAFEFCHDSWFVPEVFALLAKHRLGLVIHDHDAGCTPLEVTAGLVYVRLRRTVYTDEERAVWRERLRAWATQGLDVFAFIKHEQNPEAPLIALQFADGIVRLA